MSTRTQYALLALVVLFVANIGWRVWSNWGLISIEVQDAPVAEVMRKLEKQGGIRLRTNLPADTRVTMRVQKVSLMHALEVLSTVSGASWSVAYFTAPDKGTIENALSTFTAGEDIQGWKRFSLPMPRGFGGMEQGTPDPREDDWKVEKPADGKLHGFLEQGSQWVSAQLWAPEQWNPTVSKAPKAGHVSDVVPKLAKAAGGKSEEVFLLRGRPQRETAERRPEGEERRGRGGPPNEDMRRVMETRMLAQIEKLPSDKRDEAKAELEERKKFFEEMAQLTPEQRRERIQERMENEMNTNSERSQRFENGMTTRGAMQTAAQRNSRNQRYLERKRQANE